MTAPTTTRRSGLTRAQREALRAIGQGRAVWGNRHGPAISREEFGWAVREAFKKPTPLVRIVPRVEGGPSLTLTPAGRLALQQNGEDHD